MAKLDLKAALSGIESALKAVNELMPFAQQLGVPAIVANVSTIAIAAIAVGHNILDRATDLKQALDSNDEAKLRSMIGELQTVNDKLAEQISAEPVDVPEAPTGDGNGAGNG